MARIEPLSLRGHVANTRRRNNFSGIAALVHASPEAAPASFRTEWLLLTSGTAGVPKIVMHHFASLTASNGRTKPSRGRFCVGHVLQHTPLWRSLDFSSHCFWRCFARSLQLWRTTRRDAHLGQAIALAPGMMNPAIGKIAPRYVRLSGEIAEQQIVDELAPLTWRRKRASPSTSTTDCRLVAPEFLDTDMTRGLGCEQQQQIVRHSALHRLAGVVAKIRPAHPDQGAVGVVITVVVLTTPLWAGVA